MIAGIGTDIVEVSRIEASLTKFGDDFAKRILAKEEWAQYQETKQSARFLAKRFAAKEAFSKAMGTGLREPVTLQNIAIMHDALGKPMFSLQPVLQARVDAEKITQMHLSISDEKNLAVAFVVLERA